MIPIVMVEKSLFMPPLEELIEPANFEVYLSKVCWTV